MKLNKYQQQVLSQFKINLISLTNSPQKNKQKRAKFIYKGKRWAVHFGDPKLKESIGTKRGILYCTRSYAIKNKNGRFTRNDPLKANFWSRLILWNCKGKKSIKA